MRTDCVDPKVLSDCRRRLRRERTRLRSTVATTDAELVSLDTARLIDRLDKAAWQTTVTVMTELEDRERRELFEIDEAEARLEKGAFGACEACDAPIVGARLRALPTARLCVRCQSRREADER